MSSSKTDSQINTLKQSRKMKFVDWDKEKKKIPIDVSGIYIIWKDTDFIYAGMAGVKTNKGSSSSKTSKKRPKGLLRRLGKHTTGNRGGNLFCVYVSDRFIVPSLTNKEVKELEQGELKLDGQNGKIRNYIRTNFTFQYLITKDDKTARELEQALKKGRNQPRQTNPQSCLTETYKRLLVCGNNKILITTHE